MVTREVFFEDCPECGGTGMLTKLGGDWGATPDTQVKCWRCDGGLVPEGETNQEALDRVRSKGRA